MHRLTIAAVACAATGAVATTSQADVIGNFAGGVAEAGWGQFDPSPDFFQPLDGMTVFTVTDLDTSGDGGALETNRAGFSDSFAYDAVQGGSVAEFLANDLLVFDVIYRGDATDDMAGGFSQIFQVSFNSGAAGAGFTSIQQTAAGVSLSSFDPGGTAVGFGPGDQPPATVLEVTVDYGDFRDAILAAGGDPNGFLQIIWSTNDDNRPFKAIDNVRYEVIPEPASLGMLSLGGVALLGRRRR